MKKFIKSTNISAMIIFVSVILSSQASSQASATEKKTTAEKSDAKKTSEPVTEAQIQHWIKDLADSTYKTRVMAAKNLFKSGQAAIGPITEAVSSDSSEVKSGALQLLKQFSLSKDTKLSQSAEKALTELSKSENSSLAKAAKQTLQTIQKSKQLEKERLAKQRTIRLNGIRINGNVIINGIKINLNGAGVKSIRMENINGNKKTTIQENGVKTVIQQNKDGITIDVTKKVDGKDKTETYTAKDAKELKAKHADIYKVFEKYQGGKNGFGVMRIQMGKNFPQIPNIPAIPVVPGNLAKEIEKMMKDFDKEFKKLGDPAKEYEELRKLQKRMIEKMQIPQGQLPAEQIPKKIQRLIEQLKQQQEELKKQPQKKKKESDLNPA